MQKLGFVFPRKQLDRTGALQIGLEEETLLLSLPSAFNLVISMGLAKKNRKKNLYSLILLSTGNSFYNPIGRVSGCAQGARRLGTESVSIECCFLCSFMNLSPKQRLDSVGVCF